MFRFTIRDVLWLTVVVGLAIGWSVAASNSSKWEDRAKAALITINPSPKTEPGDVRESNRP
jgi:hypothetical protein